MKRNSFVALFLLTQLVVFAPGRGAEYAKGMSVAMSARDRNMESLATDRGRKEDGSARNWRRR
jgi:hypothetical protein